MSICEIDGARRLPSGFEVEVDGRVFDFGDASFVRNPNNRFAVQYVWTVSASLGWDRRRHPGRHPRRPTPAQ